MKNAPRVVVLVLGLLCPAACGPKEEPPKPAPPVDTGPILDYQTLKHGSPGYPLKTCVVTGKELGPDRYVIAYKGYEMQFCSKECLKEFATDPERYVRMMNSKAIFSHDPK